MLKKILLSILYVIFILIFSTIVGLVFQKMSSSGSITIGSRIANHITFVTLPVFFYCIWKKDISNKNRLKAWGVGTITALLVSFISNYIVDFVVLIMLAEFVSNIFSGLAVVSIFRIVADIIAISISFKIAKKIMTSKQHE